MVKIELSLEELESLKENRELEITHPYLGREGVNGTLFLTIGEDEHNLRNVKMEDE